MAIGDTSARGGWGESPGSSRGETCPLLQGVVQL